MANGPWERGAHTSDIKCKFSWFEQSLWSGLDPWSHTQAVLGFSRDSLTWLSNFLADRQQCINVNGYKSPWKSPKSGIPQGTVLGPVLFLVFIIKDLPSVMKSFCSIFADDTTAYTIGKDVASTCSDLSKDLDAASGWARTWGMLFNPEKSKHLAIKATDSTVSMGGIFLPKITTHSHLGVTVNEKLTWDDHVSKLYTDCARRIGILRRLRNKLNSRLCSVVWRTNWEVCKAAGRLLPKTPNPSSAPEEEVWISHPDTIFQDETSNGAAVLVFSCARSYVRIKSI